MEGQFSKELIEEAYGLLGLVKAEQETKEVTKTEPTELEKAEAELVAAQQKIESLKNPNKPEEKKEVAKAEDDDKLIKALDAKFNALGTILKAKDKEIELLKGEVEEISKANKTFYQKIGLIESQPLERKSIAAGAKPVERFEKAEGEVAESLKGKRVLALDNKIEKAEIASILGQMAVEEFKATGKEIQANDFYKAAGAVEASGSLGLDSNMAVRMRNILLEKKGIAVVRSK